MPALQHDFLPNDLSPLLTSLDFDGCIAVQARQTLEETHWLLGLANQHDWIKAVVGWVDLRSDDLPRQLEQFGNHPKLAGVRHVIHDEPDDNFMIQPEFREGISQLREHGIAYDLLLFPKHLRTAVKLVNEFPEQQFVVDHIAKPNIREGQLSPWDKDLRELAKCDNVACKLSGMVTEAKWKHWDIGDFLPYIDVVVEAFGPQRLMIGSDWPVCMLSANYPATMKIVIDYLQQFPSDAQAGILGENCARIYRIQ
jgi:L-fuconolactonase